MVDRGHHCRVVGVQPLVAQRFGFFIVHTRLDAAFTVAVPMFRADMAAISESPSKRSVNCDTFSHL